MIRDAVRLVAPSPSPPPLSEASAGADLRAEVTRLGERFAALWETTPDEPPGEADLGPAISRRTQRRNRRRADRLARLVCREVRALPDDPEERRAVERRLKARIVDFGEASLGWPATYRDAPLAEGLFGATVVFLRRARAWSEAHGIELGSEELFQALRNVWIMNGLQVLLGRPVAVTPSVFAYSMLYPLTDNFLDDTEVPLTAKAAFNRRLGRRLAGLATVARDGRERGVFALVGEIESEHSRARFPQVFEALLAIHRGQCRSLLQQVGDPQTGDQESALRPTEGELLRWSLEKGGSSVLADGFLVAGELGAEAMRFLFGYGGLLQLLDDLQDAASDRAMGHWTLFSLAAGVRSPGGSAGGGHSDPEAAGRPLDRLTGRLARFIPRVLAAVEGFEAPGWELTFDLIRRHCPLLLILAVGDQRELFAAETVARVEACSPVRFAAVPGLRRRVERRWRRTQKVLLARRGADSLLDLLDA